MFQCWPPEATRVSPPHPHLGTAPVAGAPASVLTRGLRGGRCGDSSDVGLGCPSTAPPPGTQALGMWMHLGGQAAGGAEVLDDAKVKHSALKTALPGLERLEHVHSAVHQRFTPSQHLGAGVWVPSHTSLDTRSQRAPWILRGKGVVTVPVSEGGLARSCLIVLREQS